jgi:hypothetical protein
MQRANEYFQGAISEFPDCAPLLEAYGEYLGQVRVQGSGFRD